MPGSCFARSASNRAWNVLCSLNTGTTIDTTVSVEAGAEDAVTTAVPDGSGNLELRRRSGKIPCNARSARNHRLRALRALHGIFPERLRNSKFPLPSGTAVVTASSAPASTETVVSIVVPVFNEHTTFQALFDALLAKQLPGLRKEIIVVESNSTDGSRDLVRAYENHPDVRVIYQPGPRGKGNAVREGLKAATGDILMIQDADLEY